jgi:hypothetical protein
MCGPPSNAEIGKYCRIESSSGASSCADFFFPRNMPRGSPYGTQVCVCMCACVWVYVCCVPLCVCVRACVCLCACVEREGPRAILPRETNVHTYTLSHMHTHMHNHTHTYTHIHTRTHTGRVGGLGGTRARAVLKQLPYLRAKSRGPQPPGMCVFLPPCVRTRTQWVYSGGLVVVSARTNKSHHHHLSFPLQPSTVTHKELMLPLTSLPPPPFLPPTHSTSASAQIWLCITKSATAPVLPVRGGEGGGGYTCTHGHALRRR